VRAYLATSPRAPTGAPPATPREASSTGSSLVVDLGDRSEFSGEVYARLTGPDGKTSVVTVSRSQAESLARSWTDLYDRRLLGGDLTSVVRLEVVPQSSTSPRYEIERLSSSTASEQDTRFRVEGLGDADDEVVNRVLSSFGRTPADELVTLDHMGDLKSYGLVVPAYVVHATLRPRERPESSALRSLSISAPTPSHRVFVTRADQTWVAEVAEALIQDLDQTRESLTSKRLLALDRDDVARIELDLPSRLHVILERREPVSGDHNWLLLAPEPGPAKAHVVAGLLLGFAQLRGESIEAEGPSVRDKAVLDATGLSAPTAKVRFLANDARVLGGLLFGRVQDGQVFAMAEGQSRIVRVPASRLDALPASDADLKAPP
jgi:hypothetical protein